MLDTARLYRKSALKPSSFIEGLIAKIRNDSFNAFINIDELGAMRDAEAADKALSAGNDTILTGLPIALKDNICTKGIKTTCASDMLSGFVPTYDAYVVKRLRESGAVIIGKTNLDEFAMGSATTTSNIGPTRNPWDNTRTPGGSSGGSACAVAAGLCAGALGSDTGGSIRQPASFCGITGLKPTYGSVSRFGLVAFASSLDQIGPMAQSARDVAVLYDAIKGHDPKDATSVRREYSPTDLDGLDMKGLRIGVPGEFFAEGLSGDVERAVRFGISMFKEMGATIISLNMPHIRYGVAVYYLIATAEASSNLARYDGVRYGLRARNAKDLEDMYMETRAQGFGAEVKRRIMLGTYALSAGYYDAYYKKASQVRTLISQDFRDALEKCDLIAGPTSPVSAFGLNEMLDDPLSVYLLDIYTIPANLCGIPALSIPCGFSDSGMPIGMQLMSGHFDENRLLGAGMAFQECTKFHLVRP